tara:strand:+ start:2099 stop:2278 length:180 start_codon:yes stop_codon:yes gene_type:complete
MTDTTLLSLKEVREILQISGRTLSRWIKEDKIPAIRFSKRSIRIDPRDLENFIKERKER